MNFLDIVISVSLLYGFFKGFSSGLIKEITGLLALVVGVYVAINFSSHLEPILESFFQKNHNLVPITSFILLFIVGFFLIRLVGYILDKFTKAVSLGLISKITGAIFGLSKVMVVLCFLATIIIEYNLIKKETQNESILLKPIENTARIITPQIKKHQKKIIEKIEKKNKK